MTLKLVYAFAEGNKDLKNLLGGKGANLAEMTKLGIPVPPGFIITTDACKEYLANNRVPLELDVQVTRALRKLEDECQKRFGDRENPLLISVRSGAKNSMPGMMETILNVGLNDKSVVSLGMRTGNEQFALDAYRRLIQMYGKTVLGIEGAKFAKALDESIKIERVLQPQFMTVAGLKTLVDKFKKIVKSESGEDFPQNPREQLDRAISAVFESWNTDRAKCIDVENESPTNLGLQLMSLPWCLETWVMILEPVSALREIQLLVKTVHTVTTYPMHKVKMLCRVQATHYPLKTLRIALRNSSMS